MLRRLRVENLVLIPEAELELGGGLSAITGETGAGKTILAQAVGLLLGARGDASLVRPGASEAYVEAELELPDGVLEEEGLEALAELRPEDDDAAVVARRVFADGRTRAYAWGRSAAREDVAALAERVVAMSGQFEQRRLARPSYQLDLLDGFVGDDQLRRRAEARAAWRELQAARRRHEELVRDGAAATERLGDLRALVEDTAGIHVDDEDELRAERERLRHAAELASGVTAAVEAVSPDDGEGAAVLVSAAERALLPLVELAPEVRRSAEELADVAVRLREAALDLRSFLASLDGDPRRLDDIEAQLARLGDLRRRFRCETTDELLTRAERARAELAAVERAGDPVAVAAGALAAAEGRFGAVAEELRAARRAAAEAFAGAVSEELRALGMGEGEFLVELREREPSAAGADDVAFLIRPNRGLPFAPVAETASGGELSRIALAIAAVAGGETIIFDEIDAGIGGRTAVAVAQALRRLAERAQVITITHLPQIASVADAHFRVEKVAGDPTRTVIEPLEGVERRTEIERMLGGAEFLAQDG